MISNKSLTCQMWKSSDNMKGPTCLCLNGPTDGQRGWCWRRQQRPGRDTGALNLWESGLPLGQWPPRCKAINIETFSLTPTSPSTVVKTVRHPSCRFFLTFQQTGFTAPSNVAVNAAGTNRLQRGWRLFWRHGGNSMAPAVFYCPIHTQSSYHQDKPTRQLRVRMRTAAGITGETFLKGSETVFNTDTGPQCSTNYWAKKCRHWGSPAFWRFAGRFFAQRAAPWCINI